MNVLDLFSGIGGFSLGLERSGMRTVAFCEIEPYCRAVLRKHWPDVPIFEDIRKITGSDVSGIDVISGGFPCQPFSSANAGRARGKDDDRYIWPEMLRVIQEVKPAWVIGENVAHLDRLALETVCSDLEASGYEVTPVEIPACAVDADSIRNRIWILCHANGDGKSSGTVDAKTRGSEAAIPSDAYGESLDRIAIAWREHGYWPDFAGVDGMADGLPHRMDRLKCLGNSVVPAIPEIIGRAIMQAEKKFNP